MMSRRNTIWVATAIAAAVALASYLVNPGSAGFSAAARNTARLSGLLFALALLSRSPRFPALFVRRWQLFFAFVAAHGVHFLAVLAVVAFDRHHPLHRLDERALVTLVGGFGLLLFAAMTAGKAAQPFVSRLHAVVFYVLGALFAVAFGSRLSHAPSAAVFTLLLVALMLRAWPAAHENSAAAGARP